MACPACRECTERAPLHIVHTSRVRARTDATAHCRAAQRSLQWRLLRVAAAAPASSAAMMPPPCGWTNRTLDAARASKDRMGRLALPARTDKPAVLAQSGPQGRTAKRVSRAIRAEAVLFDGGMRGSSPCVGSISATADRGRVSQASPARSVCPAKTVWSGRRGQRGSPVTQRLPCARARTRCTSGPLGLARGSRAVSAASAAACAQAPRHRWSSRPQRHGWPGRFTWSQRRRRQGRACGSPRRTGAEWHEWVSGSGR
jgi:hypothetical protein